MFLSLLVWLSVSLILSEAAEWHRGPQTLLKDNGEASSLNGDGRTLGDIIFNVYTKNASMPSLLERMLADDTGKQAKYVQHEVRGSQPTAIWTVQSQSNGSVRKGVPHPFKGPPEAADAAHPQKGIGYAERELDLFHQMFDKYLNFKAHRTGEATHDSGKELKSTCEKLLQREEKRTESGMGGHSSQVGVKPTEADYSHRLSMGDHHQRGITARASQNTSSKETNLFPSFETFVKTMFFPFTGLPHEAPSQEGRDEATIRQEVFKTDLTQRRPEMSPMADANGALPAGPGTEPQTEEMTFTSTSMQSKVGKPTSTPDYLKDSSPTSVTEPQTEVSISTTETHSANSTTSTAVSQTVSLFTPTTEKSDVSTPSKGYDLSTSSTALQDHDFPTPSKAPQRHSSGVPSRGPQQHGFPTPSEGPHQHGFPSISNGTPLGASLTPSERPQPLQHGSPTPSAGPQQHGSPTPPERPQQHGSPTPSAGPQQHGSPTPSAGPQQHGSPTPSAGPQQHGSPTPPERPQQHGSPTPSAGPQQHGSPTPSAGPQQHGFPTISNGTPLHASVTPSERPQQLGSSTVPVGLQQLRSPVPSKGSYLYGFATHSKGLQKYSSPQPSKGPQQYRFPALSKGLAKHSLPIPAGGPQQHGSPTPSKRPQQHGSPGPSQSAAKVQSDNGTAGPPTQSPAGSETLYLLKEYLSSKGNERKSPGNGLTMTKGRGTLRRSLLIQEDEPKNEHDEYLVIEFVSTTSAPNGKRQEVARIEETADSSNQPEIPLLEKLMENLSAQSRRPPTRDDVRNLEAAVHRLNAALSEFEEAEAGQEPGRGPTLTSCRRRAGQKEAAEPRRPEPSGQADGALEEVVLFPEAVFTRGRAEREGAAQPHLSSGRRAPEKEAQEAKRTAGLPPLKRQREVEGMFPRGGPSASDTGVLGDAASRADAAQPGDGGAPTCRGSALPRYSPPPNGARGRRTPEPSVKVSSPDTPSGVKHSPLPISSSKRHRGPLHDLPLNARGQQAPAPSFIRPPVPAQVSRGSPKRASLSLPRLRSGQGASAHSTRRTSSPSSTPKPHILKGSSLSFRRNSRPRANVPAPANRTPPRPGKPSPRSAPATESTPHTLRSNTHVIRHGSMYSRGNGPKPPIRKRSLPTGPPSPRNYNAPFPLAHRPRQPASSFPSRGDGRASNISDQDLSGNRKPQRGSQGESRRAPLKRPQASSRSTKPSGGAYPPGTGNRKSFLRDEPRAVSDPHDQRVRASQPPRYGSRANPSYRLNPPPETVRHADPPHRLRSPSPENIEFSNPSLRLDPPSPENVWLSNSYHRLNPPFPENAPTSHPFHGLNSASLGNLRSSSHSRSSRPSSPENRRTSNLSQSFNPSFPDIQSSHPSSRLSSAGSRKFLNPSQGLRSSSSGNRRQLNRSFNLNPSSSGILTSSESSRRLNPYSTGNMEHSSRRHRNHSQNLNTGYRQSSSPSYNLNPSLTENGRSSSVEGPPDSGEMFPELPQRLSPRPHVKGRLSELFYKFTPPASARKRSHNPRPSSALDELSEAIPNSTPQASSVERQGPRLHLRLSQKAPQKRPSNSRDPSTRTPVLFTDAPSQISITRCIHHVHYLKTPVDRSSALRHPTPAALWDRAPFEESAITFPTERALPNPVTTPPTWRFFQSMPVPMENVAPSSLNAPSLEFPLWRQVPRLHYSRGHRRPVGLSSNPYCDPNPVVPLGASPPPEQILHRVHDLYSPTSQPSPPSVQNRPPLSTSPATTVERSATATANKRQHHRATSAAESAKRKIDHDKTAPLPKKKPSKTYRDKSTPDPVRKKLSKASPNPAPLVAGDYRPLDPPPNKSPSGPLDKKSWSPPLVSNPSEARSQASAADRPANRAPFLAVPNVGGQIAQNHHRAVAPAVGLPSSSTMDLDHRGPLDHLGSRQALPRPGHAAYSPRSRNSRLSSSGRSPGDTIPSRLPSRRAYQFIRSIGAGIRSWAFPSGGRAGVAPAPQRAPPTLASRRVSSPPSGPVPGLGSVAEAPRSPANPAAPGKLAASRLGNVPGPEVERTM